MSCSSPTTASVSRACVVAAVEPAQAEEELDVLADAEEGDERRLLGDEREPVAAECGAAGPVELVDPLAEHDDLAGAREVEPGEQVQERRLARARRPGDDGQPAGRDRRAQAGKDGSLARALDEIPDLDRDAVGRRGRGGLRRLGFRGRHVLGAFDQHRVLGEPRPRARADAAAAQELFRHAEPASAGDDDLLAVRLRPGLLGAHPAVADVDDAVGDRR